MYIHHPIRPNLIPKQLNKHPNGWSVQLPAITQAPTGPADSKSLPCIEVYIARSNIIYYVRQSTGRTFKLKNIFFLRSQRYSSFFLLRGYHSGTFFLAPHDGNTNISFNKFQYISKMPLSIVNHTPKNYWINKVCVI